MTKEEQEKQILEIVRAKYDKTGGNNGNAFGDFDEILNMAIPDRNVFLERMAAEKKIKIMNGPNFRMVTLPKNL